MWVQGQPKFLELDVIKSTETDVVQDDWRPFRSIQENFRKVIFTIDDKYIYHDIRGDSRIVFLEWGDDLEGIVNRDYILDEINRFR